MQLDNPIAQIDPIERGKSYQDFLDALRAFESSIDPAQAAYYAKNYHNPHAIQYQKVDYPGRVVRDQHGNPEVETTSVQRYFQKLGIDHLYTPGSTDPKMFHRMQYSVLNFLGFVGYQFSEQDLWSLGYYTHFDAEGLPEFYSDVDTRLWAHGIRDAVLYFPNSGFKHITDVNTWKGQFTGKHDIHSMDDVKDPYKQDFIARDHFVYKHDNIVKGLADKGKTLADFLGTKLYWDQCFPPISPPRGGRKNEVLVTMSGLLAGAHLRGAVGVVALLIKHENHADEIGTTILQYVQDYAAYETPFHPSLAVQSSQKHIYDSKKIVLERE